MPIIIRPFVPKDRSQVTALIEELQNHVAAIDPDQRIRRGKDFDAKRYTDRFLRNMAAEQGVIFIAESKNGICGCIAGTVREIKSDDLENYPCRVGDIRELIVKQSYRRSGIGRKLLSVLEKSFQVHGCERIAVECFAPNITAARFYKRQGFAIRDYWMSKSILRATTKKKS